MGEGELDCVDLTVNSKVASSTTRSTEGTLNRMSGIRVNDPIPIDHKASLLPLSSLDSVTATYVSCDGRTIGFVVVEASSVVNSVSSLSVIAGQLATREFTIEFSSCC